MDNLNLFDRLTHFVGKLRRVYLAKLRPEEVTAGHARRRGECGRCGACCRLAFDCPHLEGEPGATSCRVHDRRHTNCRIFPVDERDIADRDLVPGYGPCGYRFVAESDERDERGADPRPPLCVVRPPEGGDESESSCPSCRPRERRP